MVLFFVEQIVNAELLFLSWFERPPLDVETRPIKICSSGPSNNGTHRNSVWRCPMVISFSSKSMLFINIPTQVSVCLGYVD